MVREIAFQKNFFRFAYRILIWHLRYFTGLKPRPLACGCYITSRCNFRCEFCNIWRIKPDFQISQEQAERLIKELAELGLIYFSFSGGEPLVIPYIFDLLAYAKQSGIIYTHIVSNGYLMDKNKANRLKEANVSEISFSLDGDQNIHDKIRGVNDAFNKVMEAMDYVKTYAPKTKIVLNTILNPVSPENALFAVETARQQGVKIKIQPMNRHPCFGLQESMPETKRSLQADEKEKLLDAIKLMQASPSVINSRPFLENYKAFMFCSEENILAKDTCIFGSHHIEFFANQLFPCLEGLNWKDGFDIFTAGSIKKILTSSLYLKKLQELKKCALCKKNYYICYYEPRLNFPVWNFIKSRLHKPSFTGVRS